jgi:hypothetical protein
MIGKDGTELREFPFTIDGRRTKVAVVIEDKRGTWFAIGHQFGPTLLVKAYSCETAFDVFDEHCGERVDPADPALLDYEPDSFQLREAKGDRARGACVFAAMDSGEIRINDGGTTVWADPNEWMREIPQSKARGRTCRRR